MKKKPYPEKLMNLSKPFSVMNLAKSGVLPFFKNVTIEYSSCFGNLQPIQGLQLLNNISISANQYHPQL